MAPDVTDAAEISRTQRNNGTARSDCRSVRELLEQQYLESVGGQAKEEYAALDHGEQTVVLKTFLQKLLARWESDQWAKVLLNIL